MWTCTEVALQRTGGAWTIGYKAWGSLLGRRLSKHGCLCYCIDYRNFPQACDLSAACLPRLASACRPCNGLAQIIHPSRLCCLQLGFSVHLQSLAVDGHVPFTHLL